MNGSYTVEELTKVFDMNNRDPGQIKPNTAFYRKSISEIEPSWREKRELVEYLINESNISPAAKVYLQKCESYIPHYQLRGFKYGLVSSSFVYLFFPVVRKQPFAKRFLISMLPMYYFMKWGHTWGHENYWRRAKEVTVTYEILVGTRSKFTMK